jgi:di/tricarboxylate transporter
MVTLIATPPNPVASKALRAAGREPLSELGVAEVLLTPRCQLIGSSLSPSA